MSDAPKTSRPFDRRRMRFVALSCGAFAFGMVGAAYASVPLYTLFCQITGYGGTTQRAEANATSAVDHDVRVRFDANASPLVPWTFQPTERQIDLKLGETRETAYRVRNDSDRPVTALATFNVTPLAAGAYFNKLYCFCFNEQTLQPGEELDMPVVFFVDPAILDDPDTKTVPTITLSYTFFPAKDAPLADAGATVAGSGNERKGSL